MRLKHSLIFSALALLSLDGRATLLSDSFIGLERSALQDALPGFVGDDPFQSVANPAWVPEVSRVALLHTSGLASMNNRAARESTTHVLALALQERKARWSYGFFAILPTGAQAILDTGDPLKRSSPWMNMNRQLLYAANMSRSFDSEAWRVGLLVPVSFDANAVARTRLEAADVRSRASVSLEPRLSWAVGANWSPPTLYGHTFSLLYKEVSKAEVQAEIEGNIPLFALDLAFRGESAYGYDPRRVSLNAIKRAALWSFGLRARFSQWSQYSLPFVRVTQSSLEIEDTTPTGRARNTWDLAAGGERWLAPGQALAFSLGWRQSPFKNIDSFHDADHYIVGAGWTAEFSEIWSVSTSLRLHVLDQGVLYTWAGLGLGYRL
jgi:hypothetical protein